MFVLKKIEICDPLLPPLESAIAGKCEVPQPHVLIFFLISSSFSTSSTIANSNQKFLEAIQKTYQIWHSWFMIILWVFFWIIFFFIFSFFYFSWAKIILGIFFLNKIFFVFVFFFFFFDWQRLATIHVFLLRQKQTFRGPYKLNVWLRQNLTKRKININSVLRRISLFGEFQSREWHILLTDAFFPISIRKE